MQGTNSLCEFLNVRLGNHKVLKGLCYSQITMVLQVHVLLPMAFGLIALCTSFT